MSLGIVFFNFFAFVLIWWVQKKNVYTNWVNIQLREREWYNGRFCAVAILTESTIFCEFSVFLVVCIHKQQNVSNVPLLTHANQLLAFSPLIFFWLDAYQLNELQIIYITNNFKLCISTYHVHDSKFVFWWIFTFFFILRNECWTKAMRTRKNVLATAYWSS